MRYVILILFTCILSSAAAQRTWRNNSVLASGDWYKLSVKQPGVYRINIAFLQSLGVNVSNLASGNIRLFGNGGQMLPEDNAVFSADDLTENAIQVADGGDGVINGSDYILFYAAGPQQWIKDSTNKRFRHRKNLYSSESFYFLNISTNGLRIQNRAAAGLPNQTVTSFKDRMFYELDTINFLRSGKEWYGEEFSNTPGSTLNRTFNLNITNGIAGSTIFSSGVASRSNGIGSSFTIRANNINIAQHSVSAVGTGTYDPVAAPHELTTTFNLTQPLLSLQYSYQPGSVNAQGWLNWFELFPQRQLSMTGIDQLHFSDWETVGPGNIAEFRLQGAVASTLVWDITDPLRPQNITGSLNGTEFRFTNTADRLREYIAFQQQNYLQPTAVGKIVNQDLHGANFPNYIIVTHTSFLSEAQRLATWHRQNNGLTTLTVTTEQVYNEFGSGTPDPSSIRNFVKMFYDRAGSDTTKRPRYLLLFGDASYDYLNRISGNTNYVPCFESEVTLDPLSTYTSDDFFGFLDDNDNINRLFPVSLLDIGIGRIPAKSVQEAKAVVDKIIKYHAKESFGPWRNDMTVIADDEDNNIHLDDAEFHSNIIQQNKNFNLSKIYLDAFRQQSGSGGSRYPEVNQAINNKIFAGTLIWNYSGHGGSRRLAEEAILEQDMVNSWSNISKLPLFITATCDFAPYDNPSVNSIGENILLRERTGAIALMTTTRVVFAFSNRIINNNYFQQALQKDANGKYPSLGDAVKRTKNFTYQTFGDIINNRKFTLLGDPAVRLAFPELNVRTTAINNHAPAADTLKALDRYTIRGEVTDAMGNKLSNFNGNVYPVIFDKPQQQKTFANDATSISTNFSQQANIIFKGKAKVTNGEFVYSFVVPKDINYQFGNGKISYYAEDGSKDGNGAETTIIIGGASANPVTDNAGPTIKAYLNDEKFVNGGITNENPVLLLKLADSSGINTVGTGIGHDLIATLDDDNSKFYVLNDYYEADADSYQSGTVRFQLPALTEGLHVLKIKAWDVQNNSSEYRLEFRVIKDAEFKLDRLYNYPNPFTTRTTFMFEHNRPGDQLLCLIRIYSISGKVVKTITRTIINEGNRSFDIEWDGKDDFGQKVGRGVYIYQLEIKDSNGKKQSALQKLVLL
ncbi:type IX secretion system sortase PorU [Lacibacter luteus]|uniref:Type IX secretion system sortase PorU n=1 Tax=Lacibacter luteus TaxID=2508719 RepID=A0A4Q1CH54_9BACT|nr:type IX secretion system sortase PorU [Lacibacter luteus]RXK59297.1 type IX secretion system sortase PorU [Lacibacter luteus]